MSLQQNAEVTSDFTRDDPQLVTFPLLSQLGTTTTSDLAGTRLFVVDSSVRGIAIASIYYDFNVLFTPVLDTPLNNARFFVEVADCLYVDDIDTSQTGSQELAFTPSRVPNLFTSQVGETAIDSSLTTGQGGFSEVFQFPDRVLYRRWGAIEGGTIDSTDGTSGRIMLQAAPITSLKYQSPVDYAAKRVKRRAFLRDNQALYCAVNLVGHNPDPIDVAVNCNVVIVYRTVR